MNKSWKCRCLERAPGDAENLACSNGARASRHTSPLGICLGTRRCCVGICRRWQRSPRRSAALWFSFDSLPLCRSPSSWLGLCFARSRSWLRLALGLWLPRWCCCCRCALCCVKTHFPFVLFSPSPLSLSPSPGRGLAEALEMQKEKNK